MNPFGCFSSGLRYVLVVSLFTSALFSCNDEDEPPVPEVTSINPSSALPNTLVSITGKSFSQVFSENKVSFNGKEALVTNASSTQLNVLVPDGAETGPVVVTVRGKTATNQVVFTVLALPSEISNVAPTTGGYNTLVTITGANFFSSPEANVVTFNGVQGTVTSATPTSLTVKVPARAGSGAVIVNGVAAAISFNYVPEVFIAGYVGDASGYSRATYWKNGVPTTLANTGLHTYANDIAIVNDDVYVVGYRFLGSHSVARWWKNGTEMPVSNDAYSSSAESILVDEGDVFISGYEYNSNGKGVARYWKNGQPVDLTDGSTNAFTYDIAVDGEHVYVGGTLADTNGNSKATYWKDGVAHVLTTGVSFIWDMYVSGNDVYTTGSIRNTGPGVGFVSYWKNDEAFLLSPGLGSAAGRGIVVVGDDVYVAGVEDNSKFVRLAKYWKNGNPVILTDGASYAVAYAIDVVGEDVYVVGMEYNSTGIGVAKYWKNGVPIALTDGGYFAFATSIVLR